MTPAGLPSYSRATPPPLAPCLRSRASPRAGPARRRARREPCRCQTRHPAGSADAVRGSHLRPARIRRRASGAACGSSRPGVPGRRSAAPTERSRGASRDSRGRSCHRAGAGMADRGVDAGPGTAAATGGGRQPRRRTTRVLLRRSRRCTRASRRGRSRGRPNSRRRAGSAAGARRWRHPARDRPARPPVARSARQQTAGSRSRWPRLHRRGWRC